MISTEKQIAGYLLDIHAVRLKPTNPFTWASGWKSPIYCDNRKILSYPEVRNSIRESFSKKIKDLYPDAECIAGVATGAIAHGVLVADLLKLPFIYVRSSAKGHGLKNLIEGELKTGQKTIVIEDLISTGKSSLNAVSTIREAGGLVMGLLAIFSYGFEISELKFRDANCRFDTLTNYGILLDLAVERGIISKQQIESLNLWRRNPSEWKP